MSSRSVAETHRLPRYNADEVRNLRAQGELPETFRIPEIGGSDGNESDAGDDIGFESNSDQEAIDVRGI